MKCRCLLPLLVVFAVALPLVAEQMPRQAYAAAKSGLLMRTAPRRDAARVVSIPYGAKVAVQERGAQRETIEGKSAPWYKVHWTDLTGQERTGWVFGGFLATAPLADFHRIVTGRFRSFETGDYGHLEITLEKGGTLSLWLFGPVRAPDGLYDELNAPGGGGLAGKRLRLAWAKRRVWIPENDGLMDIEVLDELEILP